MEGVKLVKTKSGRRGAERSFDEGVEDLLDTHELQVDVAGTKVTVTPENDEGKVSLTVDTGAQVDGRGERRGKMRKFLICGMRTRVNF